MRYNGKKRNWRVLKAGGLKRAKLRTESSDFREAISVEFCQQEKHRSIADNCYLNLTISNLLILNSVYRKNLYVHFCDGIKLCQ